MSTNRRSREHAPRSSNQLSLIPGKGALPPLSHDQFPNNYASHTAGSRIETDLLASHDQLIITGFASLQRIIAHLVSWWPAAAPCSTLRILLGHEPIVTDGPWRSGSANFSQAITDYWSEQGVSVKGCARIIAAIEILGAARDAGRIAVRISDDRVIHAKLYKADGAITTGSSNFSSSGLERQIESNVRFTQLDDPQAFAALDGYAEWVWAQGRDYLDELIALLEQLLKVVTWQEALGRACAEILEGDWAERYVRPAEIHEDIPLWPTQRQGIAQALWIMENLGSVLVADATGSGKTRMGARLINAVVDRMWQTGRKRPGVPVLTCPQNIEDSWKEELNRSQTAADTYTHGILSTKGSKKVDRMSYALRHAQVFAVDEAHNFLDPASKRTRTLYGNMADYVMLFTATPINKGARDLIAMVDILGADNFDDQTLKVLERLRRHHGDREDGMLREERAHLRHAIEGFMVRRTMGMLNRAIDDEPDAYRDAFGHRCRYPDQRPATYTGGETAADREIAVQIRREADRLRGMVNIGRTIAPLRSEGEWQASLRSPEDDLELRLKMASHLAVYQVVSCLRSSRAALIEHIHGTEHAKRHFQLGRMIKAEETGNYLQRLRAIAGHVPENYLGIALPSWLSDPAEHARACEEERGIYQRIGELAARLSDARENAKADLLRGLLEHHRKIVAFDWHLITLSDMEHRIQQRGSREFEVLIATGSDGATRNRVQSLFDYERGGADDAAIALCSEAMSESIGLQRASAIVHLDMPSTIRRAEQRTGRVTRMNSPHATIDVLWPLDSGAFALRLDERLVERNETVETLIGANLKLPAELSRELEVADRLTAIDDGGRQAGWDDLRDAFAPVRSLLDDSTGLVPPDVYEQLRGSKARVLSAVSVVEAASPWAFFAIAGTEWGAPRWAYLDDETPGPVIDLEDIVRRLRDRLGAQPADRPLDDAAAQVIDRFSARLGESEYLLLPRKKQRALAQMTRVLKRYAQEARRAGDDERMDLVAELQGLLGGRSDDRAVDLRTVADCWLSAISPYWETQLARRRRHRPVRIRDIEADLLKPETQIPTEQLRASFEHAPLWIKPLDKRVVAAIVGLP